MSRASFLAGLVLAGCVELEKNYEPVTCSSPALPAALVPGPGDLPGALFDPGATAFPTVSIEIEPEQWRLVCENGSRAALAYDERREPHHLWASARMTLGKEVVEDVGVRFMGRSTVTALFEPFEGEAAEGPLDRCYAAYEPTSVRYDPATGRGTFPYRPSFKIDFELFAPGREFYGQKRIALAGETGYRTLLDEWLPNQLFAAAGLPHVRAGHAALCVNGTYRGIFMVVQEDDDQTWLDDHFAGMEPAAGGAFFKIDPFGPQTYHSADPEDYVDSGGDPYYDPRAGTTAEDLATLLEVFKVGNVDTRDDDDAFRNEMIGRLDVNWWLQVIAMEMILGDVDGMHANRNNYLIVQRPSGHWVPVRRDPDLSFFAWWREADPSWHDWPGMSALRGPSLLCLRPRYSGARPNCVDGSAPLDPDSAGFTTRNVRHPALSARLINAFLDDYLETADELLASVLVAGDIRARIEERAALIEPWIGSPERPRLDPWGPDYFAWVYSLRGDPQQTPCVGMVDGVCDCSDPESDCTLVQAVDFYLQQARAQIDGIRAGTMPSQCPRDPPQNPSYDALLSCP